MEGSELRRFVPAALITSLAVLAAACAGASSPSAQASSSATPGGATATPGATATATPAATPGYTTGPGGSPIGTWSLTLVGGPTPGDYGGRDEMICVGAVGAPRSVTFQPVGSAPIQLVAATTFGADSSVQVSAGGIESAAFYHASSGQPFQTVVLGEATIDAGVLTFSIYGTQQYPGEEVLREISLTATCPLFPAETDG